MKQEKCHNNEINTNPETKLKEFGFAVYRLLVK